MRIIPAVVLVMGLSWAYLAAAHAWGLPYVWWGMGGVGSQEPGEAEADALPSWICDDPEDFVYVSNEGWERWEKGWNKRNNWKHWERDWNKRHSALEKLRDAWREEWAKKSEGEWNAQDFKAGSRDWDRQSARLWDEMRSKLAVKSDEYWEEEHIHYQVVEMIKEAEPLGISPVAHAQKVMDKRRATWSAEDLAYYHSEEEDQAVLIKVLSAREEQCE